LKNDTKNLVRTFAARSWIANQTEIYDSDEKI